LAAADLRPHAEAGATFRQIADALGCSISTVRYWLRKHDLEELRRARRPRKSVDVAVGTRELRRCPAHGDALHVVRTDGYCRCLLCVKQRVGDRRRQVKEILIAEAGGECVVCGYDSCAAALHFHHVDPSTKSFAISSKGVTRSLETARREARKCVLVCSNCHAEVEHGLLTVDWAEAKVTAAIAAV
jgi:transposase-like protein